MKSINITKIIEVNDLFHEQSKNEIVNSICTEHNLKIENNPDILRLELTKKSSIGIQEISELIRWSYVRPYSNQTKTAFIMHGDLLTVQAQNSLLKVTEEPPLFTYIYIFVSNHKNLLETIVSRSEVLNNKSERTFESDEIEQFLNMSLIDKFKFADNKSKSDIRTLLGFYDNLILKHRKHSLLAEKLLEYKELLQRNVNKKLILYNTALKLDNFA